MQRAISAHGIIGDMRTAALVADDGSIDFWCWPRFDSPSLFAALLDQEHGGIFRTVPECQKTRRQQLYLPGTNVLQTRWLAEQGVVEQTDWMPIDSASSCILRKIAVVKGEVVIKLVGQLAHDYGRAEVHAKVDDNMVYFTADEQPTMVLSASCALTTSIHDPGRFEAEWVMREGECYYLQLGEAALPAISQDAAERSLAATIDYWRRWSQCSLYRGRWAEVIERSALTLKLLTHHESGAIIAAPTFGLPEAPGGSRNWDYRYTWVRDASFTVYALIRLGYTEEAQQFMGWLGDYAQQSSQTPHVLQLMYGIAGEDHLDEQLLSHLSGYGGAQPVRIGNQAYQQLQLDIFGELMDAIYLTNKYGEAISHQNWQGLTGLINHVCQVWQQPDAGIWEKRDQPQHHLHSRLMCWVAVDRAIRLAMKRSLPMPEHCREIRTAIYQDIWTRFWNEERGHFVQRQGGAPGD